MYKFVNHFIEWMEKLREKAATNKTGITPTVKFTKGLNAVCLSLKGGAEYNTPKTMPTTIDRITDETMVMIPKPKDNAAKSTTINTPFLPSFRVYSDLKRLDLTSRSTSKMLFNASTPLHKQKNNQSQMDSVRPNKILKS